MKNLKGYVFICSFIVLFLQICMKQMIQLMDISLGVLRILIASSFLNICEFMKIKWDNITKAGLINFFSALYFYLPITTLWYQSRGLNLTQIQTLTGILIGTIFISNVPTGILADKIGRKPSIFVAMALQVCGEILFFFSHSFMLFAITYVIAGLGFSFMAGAFDAIIYDSLKEEGREDQMKKVIGSIGAMKGLSTIIGAGISSVILAQLTPSRFSLAIILTILTVSLVLLVSLFLKEPAKSYTHHSQTPKQLINGAVAVLRGNHSLRRIVILAVITTPFIGYLQSLYQPYFQALYVPGQWFGLALSLGGLIALLTTKYAYFIENKLGSTKALLIFTLLPGVFYLFMSLTFNPVLAVLFFVLNYGSMHLQNPLFSDYTNRHLSSQNRATVLSAISTISSAYIALMGPIIGKIADYSVPMAFVFMGSIVIFGAIILRVDDKHLSISGE